MSSLMKDIKASFKAKGFQYVSIEESPKDRDKSILTYKDASGKTVTKEVDVRLDNLEETITEVDVIDPEDIANFLLGSRP